MEDLDLQSEIRLNAILFRPEDHSTINDAENLLETKKGKQTDNFKVKKLSKENKLLRQQVAKMKELIASDKNLK